jgi:co-chaperonin GroES (HSP10)
MKIMTKTLYVPEHVKKEIEKNKTEVKKSLKDNTPSVLSKSSTGRHWVEPGNRVLDPSLLTKSLLERLPQPTGWRILVMPYQGKAKTSGGIYVPDEVRERESVATVVAYVLKIGPLAYGDKEKYGDKPWCQEKQWVCIGRYSGSRFKIDGGEVRIINDDEVIATILDPDDVKNV